MSVFVALTNPPNRIGSVAVFDEFLHASFDVVLRRAELEVDESQRRLVPHRGVEHREDIIIRG